MVSQQRLSEEPENTTNDEDIDSDEYPDDVSITTSQDEEDKKDSLDIVATDDAQPASFGNIVVKNSSEVHFGNKTFYQGPVTIKQFMYNAPTSSESVLSIEDGKDIPEITTDGGLPISGNGVIKNGVNGVNHFTDNHKTVVENGDLRHWCDNRNFKYKIFLLGSGFLFSIFIILLITFLVRNQIITNSNTGGIFHDDTEQDKSHPIDVYDPEANVTLAPKLRIVSRFQWVAQPPVQPANPLKTPVPYVVILHSATDNCSVQAACVLHVRYIQSFHVDSNGWWDIGYNFLVGGDGLAYEGRGWTNEGAFAYGYNSKAIGIAFIGTFNNIMPPPKQILAAKRLIALGVEKGYIAKDYKLLAHRQLSPTQSPGDMLYADMKTWPHWVNSPDNYVVTQRPTESNRTIAQDGNKDEKNSGVTVKISSTEKVNINSSDKINSNSTNTE